MAATPKEIGARLQDARKRRALTQKVAAGLAGISLPYYSSLERGERHFNRRGLLEDLAQALTCSVVELAGLPYEPEDRRIVAAKAAIPEIKMALVDCTLDDVPDLAPRPVADLAAVARLASEHNRAARYDLSTHGLGQLLTDLHVVAVTGDGADREAALAALVEAAVVASQTVGVLRNTALARDAAERGLEAASWLGDPALFGIASWQLVQAVTWTGARRRATSAAIELIDSLAGADPTGTDTLAAEAYGYAHCTRALLAARSGDAGLAHDHLDEAWRIACHTGERNSLQQQFGPANIAVWRVSVGAELQEGGKVYERAQAANVDTTALGMVRIGRWHLDLARALAQEGGRRDAEALRHLDLADHKALQRTRHDPLARELLAELKRRARGKNQLLDSLCHRFGVIPS
jgi:transcriptional regulator with XRE-family HTH domain